MYGLATEQRFPKGRLSRHDNSVCRQRPHGNECRGWLVRFIVSDDRPFPAERFGISGMARHTESREQDRAWAVREILVRSVRVWTGHPQFWRVWPDPGIRHPSHVRTVGKRKSKAQWQPCLTLAEGKQWGSFIGQLSHQKSANCRIKSRPTVASKFCQITKRKLAK